MILVDGLLVRRALAPFERLRESMRRVDPLQPGERLEVDRTGGEMAELARGSTRWPTAWRQSGGEHSRRARRPGGRAPQRRARAARRDRPDTDRVARTARTNRAARADRAAGGARRRPGGRPTSLEDVRRVVTRLRPDTLEDLGLVSALRALTRRSATRPASGSRTSSMHTCRRSMPRPSSWSTGSPRRRSRTPSAMPMRRESGLASNCDAWRRDPARRRRRARAERRGPGRERDPRHAGARPARRRPAAGPQSAERRRGGPARRADPGGAP